MRKREEALEEDCYIHGPSGPIAKRAIAAWNRRKEPTDDR